MLVTLLSWMIISFCIWISGLACQRLIFCLWGYAVHKTTAIVVSGIVLATLYAQAMSLCLPLGKTTFLVFFAACVAWVLVDRRHVWAHACRARRLLCSTWRSRPVFLLLCLCILVYAACESARYPEGVDTYSYHAQTIRWAEEYGVVPGLGNLHTRLAYNSAFLCLQALFSFVWLTGISLHSMTGFLWLVFTAYAFFGFSFFQHSKHLLSDIFRVVFIVQMFCCSYTSAPATDFLPMCLIAYIFLVWSELDECGHKNPVAYGLLGLLGIFSICVKLSCAPLALFALKPAYDLVRAKRYGAFGLFCAFAAFLLAPFLVRNYILSGYLLYPFPSLDLFDVDWKIPKATLLYDYAVMLLWGRNWGWGDESALYATYSQSFVTWFPNWLKQSESLYGALAVLDIACIAAFFTVRKNRIYSFFLPMMASACFLFFLLTSPQVRFAEWYMFCLPILVGVFLAYDQMLALRQRCAPYLTYPAVRILCCVLLLGVMGWKTTWHYLRDKRMAAPFEIIWPQDYLPVDDPQYLERDGYKWYYSNGSGYRTLNGYYGFPGTISLDVLRHITLRGSTLAEGFRVRPDEIDIPYGFQSGPLSPEICAAIGIQ